MTTTNEQAAKITSITVAKFIEAGGTVERLETVSMGNGPDCDVHVFTCADRDGTYTSDNACVSWIDASFERVIKALRSGDTSELPEAYGVSEI